MKYSITLAALLLAVACGKAGKIVEVPGIQPQSPNPVVEKQVKPFTGTNLILGEDGEATVNIYDLDAEKIFSSLQVEEISWSDEVTTAKTGKYIYCIKKSEEAKPSFVCSLNISPKKNSVKDNGVVKEDKSAKHLDEDFVGKLIKIDQASRYIAFKISGKDAMKLYEEMSFSPSVVLTEEKIVSTKGTSPYLRCIESQNRKDLSLSYNCNLTLDSLGFFAQMK
jgi:hypothetical protein